MKKITLFIIVFLCFTCSIEAEVIDDRIILDSNVNISDDIDSSSLILGKRISLDGKIDGVGIMVADDITINSSSDYLLTLSSNFTLNGISKDGIIIAKNVTFNESSTINRDVIILASNVSISGSINRNITIYAEKVDIKDAQIAGNIKISSNEINIGQNALINGGLSYNDDAIIDISSSAGIGKTITYKKEKKEKTLLDDLKQNGINLVNIWVVFAILMYFVPKLFNKIDEKRKNVVKNTLIGFLALIFIPILIFIFIITVFGLSLSILLAALYFILVYTSSIVTGYMLGSFVWDKFIKKTRSNYVVGLSGILILYLLKMIPYIGILVSFISILVGMGTILSFYSKKKRKSIKS